MSPLSTKAKSCRLLARPFDELSTAGMRRHSSIARRSDFGVTESLLGRRCSPVA